MSEEERKVYADRRGLWEALGRPMASWPLKGVEFEKGVEGVLRYVTSGILCLAHILQWSYPPGAHRGNWVH